MICTPLSRVSEDFHRISWTMFLAPEKSQQWPYYENTINANKAFFTFSLISISYFNAFVFKM